MNTNRALLQKTVAFILSVIFWLFVYKIGHAETSLSPTRIVFNQANIADPTLKQIVVTNTGSESVTYKLSLIEMRMNDEGKLESSLVPAAGQLSASEHLYIYPDNFTLAPGQQQAVKVRLNATAALPDGEYRSHISIKERHGNETVIAKVTTVPVIIRSGALAAQATIGDIKFTMANDTPSLQVTVGRSGNMSLYGDFSVSVVDTGGHAVKVADIKGTALYTPNTQRVFNIKLKQQQDINYHTGKLLIEYAGCSMVAVCDPMSTPHATGEYVLH